MPRAPLARVINSPAQTFAAPGNSHKMGGMDQARLDKAMSRIEVALARIEAASSQSPAPGEGALAEQHEALRARVGSALEELDGLIAELET